MLALSGSYTFASLEATEPEPPDFDPISHPPRPVPSPPSPLARSDGEHLQQAQALGWPALNLADVHVRGAAEDVGLGLVSASERRVFSARRVARVESSKETPESGKCPARGPLCVGS